MVRSGFAQVIRAYGRAHGTDHPPHPLTLRARLLAQPRARHPLHRAARCRPARRDHPALRHRTAVVRRLQPGSVTGQRQDPGQGPTRLLPLRLAHRSALALPAHPGHPCHARRHPGPGAARQAVVGGAEAVHAAARTLPRPRGRTALPAAPGRRRALRVHHRRAQRPARLRLPRLLLPAALLRGMGVLRRVPRPRGPADADRPAQSARTPVAAR